MVWLPLLFHPLSHTPYMYWGLLLGAKSEGVVRRLVCWAVMKLCVTLPPALLLPHLHDVLEGSSSSSSMSGVVTLGLLVTPVLVVPVLLLCTSPSTALTTTALTLTTLYTMMVWLSGWSVGGVGVVLVVPVCGLSGVAQTLLLAHLLGCCTLPYSQPTLTPGPGTLLGLNLSLHTLARSAAPHLAAWLSLHSNPFTLAWPSHHLGQTKVDNVTTSANMATLALSGAGCSLFLLIMARLRLSL